MNLKKIFTKIIAATLSVTAFLGALPAQAFYGREAHENIRKWVISNGINHAVDHPDVYEGLDEESTIFRNLTEGDPNVRFVSTLAGSGIHPLCSLIFLNVINRFFETHPYTKCAFMDMIKERGGNQFVLGRLQKSKAYSKCRYSCNPSILINEDEFNRANISRTFQALVNQIYRENSIIPFPHGPRMDYRHVDLMLYLAYHELGHLIQDIFTFYRLKDHSILSRLNIETLCAYAKEAIKRNPKLRGSEYAWFDLCSDTRTRDTMPPTDWRYWMTASDKYFESRKAVRLSMKAAFRSAGGITSAYISGYDKDYDGDESAKAAESWAELYSYSRWLPEDHEARMAADTLVAELDTSFEINLPDLLSRHAPLRGVL